MIPRLCLTLDHCGEFVKCGIRVIVLPSIVDYFLIPFIPYVGREPFYYQAYCDRVIEAGETRYMSHLAVYISTQVR